MSEIEVSVKLLDTSKLWSWTVLCIICVPGGAVNGSVPANCTFQALVEYLVGMKFSTVTQSERICISAVHQSSGNCLDYCRDVFSPLNSGFLIPPPNSLCFIFCFSSMQTLLLLNLWS